jgi:hypothetical protein
MRGREEVSAGWGVGTAATVALEELPVGRGRGARLRGEDEHSPETEGDPGRLRGGERTEKNDDEDAEEWSTRCRRTLSRGLPPLTGVLMLT